MGLGDLIDTAAGALGGGGGGSSKPPPGKPKFERGAPLNDPAEAKPLSFGLNNLDTTPNTPRPPLPIEFIHFGYVHDETVNHFPHPQYAQELDKKPAGRGIYFRDALHRETLLLQGLISSCQSLQKEVKANRGAMGAVGAAVGALLGGSKPEPDPATFDFFKSDAAGPWGKILAEECDYVKIHQAGLDLHQTRADYRQYLKDTVRPFYLDPKGDPAKALLMSLPSVAGAATTVLNILFSPFDICFAMFLNFHDEYAPAIETVCDHYTLDTIKAVRVPTFPIWYAPEKVVQPVVDGDDPLSKLKKDVKVASDAVDDVLSTAPDAPPPGNDRLDEIFVRLGAAAPKKDDDKDAPAPAPAPTPLTERPVAELTLKAFNDITKSSLPAVLGTVITKAVVMDVEFLKALYHTLMEQDAATRGKPIDLDLILETARKFIVDQLMDLLMDTLSFIKTAKDAHLDVGSDDNKKSVGPKKLFDQGQQLLVDKFGPYSDVILKLIVVHVADILEDARKNAVACDGVTMEAYLARLPQLLAVLVRDTIFPVWDFLIKNSVGQAAGPLDAALGQMKSLIGTAKGYADKAKDAKDRLQKAKDTFDAEGMQAGSGGQNVQKYRDILTGDKPADAAAASAGSSSLDKRKPAGKGKKAADDDPDSAEHQRSKFTWPP